MRFLAGVRSRMDCQGTPLDEALVAILDRAMVGSLIGVDAIMATEIGFAIERLQSRISTETLTAKAQRSLDDDRPARSDTYLATLFPSAVEVAATPRSHDGDLPGLRGKRKRVARGQGDGR